MIHLRLIERLREAFAQALPEVPAEDVSVRPCQDARFGDYQCMSVMPIAKRQKTNPRELAAKIIDQLEVEDLCDEVSIAGPGFINFRFKAEAIAEVLREAVGGKHLFFETAMDPQTIVIDFSSPNVAKPMHVGHIRSTILGDCLARLFRLLGHKIITDNHIGDWGTQFGMLLVGWKKYVDQAALAADPIAELERVYKHVNELCKADEAVREEARDELVKLQGGDEENLSIWKRMIALSQNQFDTIYGRLGVEFDHAYGESHYNAELPGTVESLVEAGIARESEGAMCVFSDGSGKPKADPFLIQKDGVWVDCPALIRKKDGGFNYATTDLATLEYRTRNWNPDAIVYVTDGRQQQHFQQVFNAYGRWRGETKTKLAHVWFGSILGKDKKPLKTREGTNVKLADLLDEAEQRALQIVEEKNPEQDEATKREIARVVGLGAVKYADLMPHRQSDYVFDWDKMLSFTGNAAPYLQMSYTRIRSIFRKTAAAGLDASVQAEALKLEDETEIALAKKMLEFGGVLNQVADDFRPNLLCGYLFELSGHFARFFEQCPVIKSEDAVRSSRLVLCDLTAQVLQKGLNILGIETTEVM